MSGGGKAERARRGGISARGAVRRVGGGEWGGTAGGAPACHLPLCLPPTADGRRGAGAGRRRSSSGGGSVKERWRRRLGEEEEERHAVGRDGRKKRTNWYAS